MVRRRNPSIALSLNAWTLSVESASVIGLFNLKISAG
jgi:hypothetical protein